MSTFINETEQSIQKLAQAAKEENMEQACAIAHKMLPTFIMIEAKEAVPALQWLERKRGETKYTPEADKAVHLVIEQAQNALNKAENATGQID